MPYSVNVSISVLTLYILTSVSVFPSCSLLISQGADKENLLNNQELFLLVIISFILLSFNV